ncbi:MAG: hypothetical protein K6U00_00825 [Armatimonadetes bacterium]|nr:hypothetical protein [Armatimonadota bacterium]
MNSGLVATLTVISIIFFTSLILAVSILRTAWIRREKELLTSMDLTALEESAVYLIEQLKAESNQAISDLDSRISRLESLLREADVRLSSLVEATARAQNLVNDSNTSETADDFFASYGVDRTRVLALVSAGLDDTDIARITGLGLGEVRLMKKLVRTRVEEQV